MGRRAGRRGILDPTQFVGRDDKLTELHNKLQTTDPIAITGIVGMGGVGKTELAVQYARRHLPNYGGGVVWLLGDRAAAELLAFAQGAVVPRVQAGRPRRCGRTASLLLETLACQEKTARVSAVDFR